MNRLELMVSSYFRIIRSVVKTTSVVGMICLAAMMLLTAADVLLRYLLNKPITGSYELIQFLMVVTIAIGISYTALEKGHVTIDIFTTRLPIRARGIVDSFITLLALGIVALMTWQAFVYILTLRKSEVASTVLLIPIYPFVAIVGIGLAFFCLVLLVHLLEFILIGFRK